jgi:hypothetical protein
LKTTKENLQEHCQNIPMQSLPKTLFDAMSIAKSLGFQCLWIDSLCILQNDHRDWAEQAADMTRIFLSGLINICAETSHSCDEGILKSIGDYKSITVPAHIRSSVAYDAIVFVNGPANQWLEREPGAHLRGWIFQEFLVSHATVKVSNQGIEWECAATMISKDGTKTWVTNGESHKSLWALEMKKRSRLNLQGKSKFTASEVLSR